MTKMHPTRKVCTKCRAIRSLSCFHNNKSSTDGRFSWCKRCVNAARTASRLANPERLKSQRREWYTKNIAKHKAWHSVWYERSKHKKSFIKNRKEYWQKCKQDPEFRARRLNAYYKVKYGLTTEQVGKMVHLQRNICAICRLPERAKKYGKLMPLALDHCHKTGRNRGLLCVACNMVLGRIEKVGIRKFVAYLNRGE